jgi:phosphoribosylglycinamide formyltransferase-1
LSHPSPGPWKLGVLLSGAGRTLEYLLASIAAGEMDAMVTVVISSREEVRGLEVAECARIPNVVIRRADHPTLEEYSANMDRVLREHGVDVVIMAGYLRKWLIPDHYAGRVLNIHPCLLPDARPYAAGKGMYGERVHAAVLAHGDSVSGATVHVVTEDYDEGPPLGRVEVPVLPGDTPETLGTRVFTAEKSLYPRVICEYLAAHPDYRA